MILQQDGCSKKLCAWVCKVQDVAQPPLQLRYLLPPLWLLGSHTCDSHKSFGTMSMGKFSSDIITPMRSTQLSGDVAQRAPGMCVVYSPRFSSLHFQVQSLHLKPSKTTALGIHFKHYMLEFWKTFSRSFKFALGCIAVFEDIQKYCRVHISPQHEIITQWGAG